MTLCLLLSGSVVKLGEEGQMFYGRCRRSGRDGWREKVFINHVTREANGLE